MRTVLLVAGDTLREALRRKWFLALGVLITLVLAVVSLALRMDVVNGALAATSLFGKAVPNDIRAADVALRPVFAAVAYIVFYAGNLFGIVACSDFAPSLLSPGRIEHLVALPVRRWQLAVGTFLGVMCLALAIATYGASGLAVLLGIKTGVWTIRPVIAALMSMLSFSAVYAVMLTAAMFVRSAAASAAAGGLTFLLGIVAGYRQEISGVFEPGVGRTTFELASMPFPRLAQMAVLAEKIGSSAPADGARLTRILAGVLLFAAATVCIGVWRFERRDF